MKKNLIRLTALILLIAMALPTLASAEGKTVRVNTESRVYQQATLSSLYVRLPKDLEVNLLGVNNGWAMIELNGNVGFTNAEHLSEIVDTPALDYSELMKNAKTARIIVATRIYRTPSKSADSMKVPANMQVNLLAVSGDWALVENSGVYAYMKAAHVVEMGEATPMVVLSDTRVYASASTSSKSMKVSKGLSLNRIAVKGEWALVENGGNYAYIKTSKIGAKTESSMPDGQPAVILADTSVYATPSKSAASMKVSKGMQVSLISVSGEWALVENAGVYAYMSSDLVTLKSAFEQATPVPTATPAPTATPEPEQPDYSALLKNAQAGVLNADALVYKFADTSSTSIAVSKGTEVQVLAINDGWALVERSGVYGFVSSSKVSPVATATPTATATPAPTATPTPENYMTSSKYSNEEKCYLYLTKEGGLNCAAACGILANIRRESNFNPASGSSYYGLCQWGGSRLTALKNHCSQKGLDYSSLEGQLSYLLYELDNNASSVGKYLSNVSNTAQGAYDAGWYFCYYFERPAAKESASVSRGNLAKDTYFDKYN